MTPLLRGHSTVARRCRSADDRRTTTERFLGLRRQSAKTHARDRNRRLEMNRLLGESGSQDHIGRAFLAISFQRITRDGGAEKQQVVKMRKGTFCTGTANVINSGRRGTANFGQRMRVKRRRLARQRL